MSMLNFIDEMNKANMNDFIKFLINGDIVGYIHIDNVAELSDFGDVFVINTDSVTLADELDTFTKRTNAVAKVLNVLNERGVLKKWRDELYDVALAHGSEVLMQIERCAADVFGIKKYGVHVNAFVKQDGELKVWVAKRSMQKQTYPGKLDQLVAGGFTGGGYTPYDIYVKEADEEAGIDESLARTGISTGCVSYTRTKSNKCMTRGNIFVFDIETPVDFVPKAIDGEVEDFFLMPANELLDIVINDTDRIKDNCVLIMIDFFIRHGVITSDHPDYVQLAQKLHQ